MARRTVGKLVVAIGGIHLAASAVFYRGDLLAMIDRGVVNAVEPAGAVPLDAGFWYLSAGLGMLMYGGLVWWYERNVGPAPAIVGWSLVALTAWGVVLVPASGFWAFLVPAIIAIRSARGQARQPVAPSRR